MVFDLEHLRMNRFGYQRETVGRPSVDFVPLRW